MRSSIRTRTSGRCDECRRRKKKCNEAKPLCSRCSASGVRCVYSAIDGRFIHTSFERTASPSSKANQQRTVQNIKLDLRSSWTLPSRAGHYQTFSTAQSEQTRNQCSSFPMLSPLPLSSAELLACEYRALFNLDSRSQNCSWLWHNWSHFIPSRIGSSALLDCAITCILGAHRARRTRDEKVVMQAHACYGRALHLLQNAVKAAPRALNGQVIAATKMLETYETILQPGLAGWRSHSDGAVHLIVAAGPRKCKDDLVRALVYTVYGVAWQHALDKDESSKFDNPEWLDIGAPPRSSSEVDIAESHRRFIFFTKLPRLTKLVREARSSPCQEGEFEEIRSLLESLVDLERLQEPLHMDSITSHIPETASHIPPTPIQYREPVFQNAFHGSIRCATRIMLSGLYQNAIIAGISGLKLELEELRREEWEFAQLISMSVPSLLDISFKHNVAAALLPMQLAWGALWRQHENQGACKLLDWLETKLCQCGQLLGLEVVREHLIAYTKRVDGSPWNDGPWKK